MKKEHLIASHLTFGQHGMHVPTNLNLVQNVLTCMPYEDSSISFL
jgi:hypothetical protein